MRAVLLLCKNPSVLCLGVYNSLRIAKIPVEALISSTKGPLVHSRHAIYDITVSPKKTEEYLDYLIEMGKNRDDTILLPISDDLVEIVAKNKSILSEHFEVPVPEWSVIERCVRKNKTYEAARQVGVPLPKMVKVNDRGTLRESLDEMPYPCIIKPDSAYHKSRIGKVVLVVRNRKELKSISEDLLGRDLGPLNVQEIIPGPSDRLYTLGSVLDYDCNPVAVFTGRKIRQRPIDFGVCTLGESRWVPEVAELGIKLLQKVGFYGISQVEFKLDPRDNQYKLMEINPRPWLWASLPTYCGLNLPEIYYRSINGEKIKPTGFKEGLMWQRLVSDFVLLVEHTLHRHPWFSFRKFVTTLTGRRVFATLTFSDIKPFVYELKRLSLIESYLKNIF